MQPLPVVKPLNVVKDRHACFRAGGKDLPVPVNRFKLERSKETLGHRIVIAVARPAHAADHVAFTRLGVQLVGELTSPVRVQDHANRGTVMLQSHGEGRAGKRRIMLVAHGPADNLAGEAVQDGHQVQPALQGGNVGGVGNPFLVFTLRCEVLCQQVLYDAAVLHRAGQAGTTFLRPHRAQSLFTHQASDPLARGVDALPAQCSRHPVATIGAAAVLKHNPDLLAKRGIALLVRTHPAFAPRVVSARRHLQRTALPLCSITVNRSALVG